jgi:hypothetical protein
MPDAREQQSSNDRTGKYGGDDGALEHEREEVRPGEDPGIKGTPTQAKQSDTPAQRAEQQQQRDLETGAENPG